MTWTIVAAISVLAAFIGYRLWRSRGFLKSEWARLMSDYHLKKERDEKEMAKRFMK